MAPSRDAVEINVMPYENLYIYYIDGKVPADRGLFGSGFIGNWQEENSAFLFFDEPADERVESFVAADGGLILKDRFFMPYTEWIGSAMPPFSAGGLCVLPPWLAEDETYDPNRILLDPGVVFGSGTHPTTRDCLYAMEIVFSDSAVSRTIDIGCGTGLLALAAARKGSRCVLAVDNNYLAVETARCNIVHNCLEDRVLAVHGCAEDFVGIEADLLVANIHYEVMKKLIHAPGFLRKKRFILSGLLRSQFAGIEDDLRQLGAVIGQKWVTDCVWHTLTGAFEE